TYWYKLQREKVLKELDEVLNHEDKKEREELLDEINDAFDTKINHPDYARKLFLIENCIYGVDIQPIAIQISKLRFFISLIIDQNVDKTKDNFGIRPLPNLETKFVCANTLIPLEKPNGVLISQKVLKLEEEIKTLRHRYFQAKTRTQKLRLQEKDKELRKKLASSLEEDGFSTTASKKISNFDPYDQNASADWFDPEWMFGVKNGFDMVIGNPPYIQLQKNSGALANLYKDKGYETFDRTGDIYTLFYEKGMELLKDAGHLCL
ncbi:MAG: Eco57I restriction-modification methylase domain-containing protein, partial [Thermodesulfovibrio sp.]|nr:Eco57I restriction-modification methylase domain-containing protein [Thermodesulfovibrio sp.]